jgi:hypothetical protein
MSEAVLFRALDELVPQCGDAHGDWEDVLRRAGITAAEDPVQPTRPWYTRRQALVAVIVPVTLAILFATPAYGYLRHLFGRIDFPFGGGEPAPHVIKHAFADFSLGAPPGMDPRAIADETRRIHVFNGTDGRHVLYVAPTRQGGFCEWFTNAFAGCRATRTGDPIGLTYGEHGSIEDAGKPEHVGSVGGDLFPANAASVFVEYEDGSSTELEFVFVSAPINAGFFYYAIPPGHERPGTRANAVAVRDADGNVIAREPIEYPDKAAIPPPVKHPTVFRENQRP